MIKAPISFRPEHISKKFQVFRIETTLTKKGVPLRGAPSLLGEIKATLAVARQNEKERWRQLAHPVTHTLHQQGIPPFEIRAGDYFQLGEKKYYLSAEPYNIGGLNQVTTYYCAERNDIQ